MVEDDNYMHTRRLCAYTTENCISEVNVYVCKENLCNDVPDNLRAKLRVVALSLVIASVSIL